jgi:predicted RecB family endonuclease
MHREVSSDFVENRILPARVLIIARQMHPYGSLLPQDLRVESSTLADDNVLTVVLSERIGTQNSQPGCND